MLEALLESINIVKAAETVKNVWSCRKAMMAIQKIAKIS